MTPVPPSSDEPWPEHPSSTEVRIHCAPTVDSDYWSPARRYEWACIHGIGHPDPTKRDPVHGCDGCCARTDFPPRQNK